MGPTWGGDGGLSLTSGCGVLAGAAPRRSRCFGLANKLPGGAASGLGSLLVCLWVFLGAAPPDLAMRPSCSHSLVGDVSDMC